jgi:hypothetical protein
MAAPQQTVTGSILAVDAETFLPHASMEASPYRMQVFRKAAKVLAKLDLPLDLPSRIVWESPMSIPSNTICYSNDF